MTKLSLALAVTAAAAFATGCPPKPASEPLPPPGLAGSPIDPSQPMPAGHPDIGGHAASGGDDGSPLPTKGAPLPNFGTPTGDTGMGGGGGAGGNVVFTGKVLEKVVVPSYTYMRVQIPGGEQLVDVSTMNVNVGDTVTINQQIVMENFASKTLTKTFDKLVMGTASVGG